MEIGVVVKAIKACLWETPKRTRAEEGPRKVYSKGGAAGGPRTLKAYIRDAGAEGDQELVIFFDGILENNPRAAQRAKGMLVPRFHNERG